MEILVNVCVLSIDELVEVLGLIVEHELFFHGVQEIVNLLEKDEEDANNDKVKEGELNNQEEKVEQQCQQYEDGQVQGYPVINRALSLSWLQVLV